MKKFYITTAIAYTNWKPHIWHTLEIIQADAIARAYRITGEDVVFQTGTDEHWTKIRETAQKKWEDIFKFINKNVDIFKKLYQELDISYTDFIRTTDQKKHRPGAIKLRKELKKSWDIYKKKYSWQYCSGCESFKTPKELIDWKCPDHPTREITTIEEENYFFKLSKYAPQIIENIKNKKYEISPENKANEIIIFLEKANDISFSRNKEALPRWIPIPDNDEQIMYVRCDALSNYISWQWYWRDENKFKKTRPADIHIIWKDILRFHAAFRPAMLISANIELPKKLLVHGHVTQNWKKMWKSTWNVVDPLEILKNHDADVLKFTLLYDSYIGPDANFSLKRLNHVLESMLIWSRWNLINRVTKLSQKYEINQADAHKQILDLFKHKDLEENILFQLFENWFNEKIIQQKYLDQNNLKDYIQDRYQIVQRTNEFIQNEEPRKKYKIEETKQEAIETLQFLLRIIKNLTILSSRFLTNGFNRIQKLFWNKDLSKIDTTKTIQNNELQISFNQKQFSIDLNPEIIYQRVE